MINGSIYLISPARLRDGRSFITHDTLPFIIENKREAIDIDTPFDWAIAEQALKPECLF
jgi:CMP-N-acetylneuraminic acid synthetase